MHRLNRKNWLEIGVMTVIFAIAAILVYKTTILTRMTLPRTATQAQAEKGKEYLLKDGDRIEQKFVYPSDELLSAGIQVSLDEDVLKDLTKEDKRRDLGTLHLSVSDAAGAVLTSAEYPVYALADEQNLVASFPETRTGFQDQELVISLEAEGITPDVELAVGYTEKEISHASLSINGEPMDIMFNIQTADRQFSYWKQWGAFGAVIVYLLLLLSYLSLAVFRLKPEKAFLVSGAALAVLYLLLLPPLSVPDEEIHLKQAYSYTNRILGEEGVEEGKLRMEKEDFHALQMFETTPSLPEYDKIKEEIMKTGREEGAVEIPHSDTRAPFLTYLPGVAGILFGRILGCNGLLVIYLGRICSILCYLAAMYWFIRILPYGKPAGFILAMLPMTIQQCCSYSYDSVVIEAAFLYLAVLFRLIYQKDPIKKTQIAAYVIFMILLSVCKGGTYMPLCLLTLLIPWDRFGSKKKKWIFTGVMASAAIAAFMGSTLRSVLFVVSPTEEQAAGAYLAGETYGTAGLLENPMEFITLSVRTLFLSGDGLIETMFGMQLGWLDIYVSRIVIYGLLLLLILSALKVEDGNCRFAPEVAFSHKMLYLVVTLLSAAMIFVSMFISWTPRESKEIFGIQGRYFLPLLPIAILLFYNKTITIKKDMGRKFMFAAVCLQCVAIYGILMSLERVL